MNLIVDFPKGSDRVECSSPSVRFAFESEGRYINYPTRQENLKRWYSREDEKRFRGEVLRDAIACSMKMVEYLNDPSKTVTYQDCVGLDHLISRDVYKRYEALRAGRKEHARIVLEEQNWQRLHGVNSPEDLARVSRRSSKSDRARSRKIGIMHDIMQ